MKFEKFDDVVSYMEHFTNLEKNPNQYDNRTYRLDRMSAILKHLGNPEKSFKAIHVAGSKGKGSVSAMLANAIKSLGFKCGLYASPHLIDYRERFTLAGDFFSDSLLIHTGIQLKQYIDTFTFENSIAGNTYPTTFELYTAFAYLLFKNANCEYAVIETGLGGRLDATNTLDPIASVITPIELEHTSILGNTIKKIATEKSKIIKPNTPCFISFQQPEALKVFVSEAQKNKSHCYLLQDEVKSIKTFTTQKAQNATIEWTDNNTDNLKLSLLGSVQSDNAALALLCLKKINLYKKNISEKAIEQTQLAGRFEKIADFPPIYIDGAHTVSSLSKLVKSFLEIFPNTDNTVIFCCLPDKNISEMTDIITNNLNKIIVSKPGTYKKSNPSEIFEIINNKIKGTSKKAILLENSEEALNYAKKITPEKSAILVTGSFYLAASIKESLLSCDESDLKPLSQATPR